MLHQTLLQQLLDKDQRAWFGDVVIHGRMLLDGTPVLCDHAGRIIPWQELEECYQALRAFYDQYTPEEIAEYNAQLPDELPQELPAQAWRRQRRSYRPGTIYLLHDPAGVLQPTKGAYKIGRTTQFNLRMQMYGTHQRPFKLVHTVAVQDAVWAETFLVRVFEAQRVHGREWFTLSDDDIVWIKSLPSF